MDNMGEGSGKENQKFGLGHVSVRCFSDMQMGRWVGSWHICQIFRAEVKEIRITVGIISREVLINSVGLDE